MRGSRRTRDAPTSFEFDATLAEPWRAAAQSAWTTGNWTHLEQLLVEAPDADARVEMMWLAPESGAESIDAWMDDWAAHRPGSAILHACRGVRWIKLAWAARGSGWSDTVTEDGAQRFVTFLRRAEAELVAAMRMAPDEALVWAASITSALGLGVALEEIWDRYRQVERIQPWSYDPTHAMAQVLAPKWLGSVDELLGFVEDVSARAPIGDPIHAVVAQAHVELVLKGPDGWEHNEWAAASTVAALDRSRLTDPQHRLDAIGWKARNVFACALYLLHDDRRSADLLGMLGWRSDRLTESPWHYLGEGDAATNIWQIGRHYSLW